MQKVSLFSSNLAGPELYLVSILGGGTISDYIIVHLIGTAFERHRTRLYD